MTEPAALLPEIKKSEMWKYLERLSYCCFVRQEWMAERRDGDIELEIKIVTVSEPQSQTLVLYL